jgi:3-phosphoshikimate 1-carboxyvinyltransferase
MSSNLPEEITIGGSEPLSGSLQIQPSKNYLTRYLWTSCLCEGVSRVSPVLPSDDARAMVHCMETLGAKILGGSLEEGWLEIQGFGANPKTNVILNPDNAGAVLRLLLGVTALGGPYRFETERMDSLGTRPNRDLLDALANWGVNFPGASGKGTLPLESTLDSTKTQPETTVSGEVSSQYLSSLLFVAPLVADRLGQPVTVIVTGDLKSRAAVETTLDVMRNRGIQVDVDDKFERFDIQPGSYQAGEFHVNGDWPGAAALLCAAAAVPKSKITLTGLKDDCQGERHILSALESMGCTIQQQNEEVTIEAPSKLKPLERFNGDLMTDAIPPLMAVLALADGTSRIENVENLRYKECNRITDPLNELRKLGVESREGLDWFEIDGRPDGFDGGVTVSGHKDHRVIMLLCIAGLRCRQPISITTADHIAKSFPGFFENLQQLGVKSLTTKQQ